MEGGSRQQEDLPELLKMQWSFSKVSVSVGVPTNFRQDCLSRVEIKKCNLHLGYGLQREIGIAYYEFAVLFSYLLPFFTYDVIPLKKMEFLDAIFCLQKYQNQMLSSELDF